MGLGYSKAVENRTRLFVKKYGPDIIAAIKGTGLFFSAVVAQKAYESGYGDSPLAKKYNNLGGIKNFGSLPNAGVVMIDSSGVVNGKNKPLQPYATFATPKLSFETYVKVLQDPNKKYLDFGVFAAKTPEDQIMKIARAGYTVTNAVKYLAGMQSIINACRDLYPLGKIS